MAPENDGFQQESHFQGFIFRGLAVFQGGYFLEERWHWENRPEEVVGEGGRSLRSREVGHEKRTHGDGRRGTTQLERDTLCLRGLEATGVNLVDYW